MLHLNGDMLCAIDTETTGTDPFKHSVWQISCIPLDFNLRPSKKHTVFDVTIQPLTMEYDPRAISKEKLKKAMSTGLMPEVAAQLFHEWYLRLHLGLKKRIIPLAHNWVFDKMFLTNWLGEASMELYFDPRYRDTMVLAACMSDVAGTRADKPVFDHMTLRHVAQRLHVEWDDGEAHDSLYDAHKTIEIYRRFMHRITFI